MIRTPSRSSFVARRLIEANFGGGSPNLVLLATSADGNVDSAASVAAGRALTAELAAEPGVRGVASYWSLEAARGASRLDDRRRNRFGG